MTRAASRRSHKREYEVTRCLAIKDDGTICGTILNSHHDDIICYNCRHRFAYSLQTPKLAELEDYLKQKGVNHGG